MSSLAQFKRFILRGVVETARTSASILLQEHFLAFCPAGGLSVFREINQIHLSGFMNLLNSLELSTSISLIIP